MRIQTWHDRKLRENADYATAHADIGLSEWLADLIVDRRVARGLTQVQLAELAGTTQATVSQLENGLGNPRLDTLARLLTALEVATRDAWDGLVSATRIAQTNAYLAETNAILASMTPVEDTAVFDVGTVAPASVEFTPPQDDRWQTAGVWSQGLAAAA